MSQIRRDLPDFTFIDVDPQAMLDSAIAEFSDTYFSLTGETIQLGEADPFRILIYSTIYQKFLAIKMAEHVAKQNLLAFAEGDILDYRAANYGKYELHRLPAQKAKTTLRFSLSAVRDMPVNIPVNTKVTAGDSIYFSTMHSLSIPAGELFGEVSAECCEAGGLGNGYSIGSIKLLVDPVAYVSGVYNIDVSSGGADVESDDSLRDRIYLAPEGFSTAGPSGAYIYHAKSFDSTIADVRVHTPEPGFVRVVVLLKGGQLPSPTLLAGLEERLMNQDIRPLTDLVDVTAPDVVEYEIQLTYYINSFNAASENLIRAAVDRAVNDYITWQEQAIGRDIVPSRLVALLMAAGVKRVEVVSPVYRPVHDWEAAKHTTLQVVYGGLEDD